MNDDLKTQLTAWALDELPPDERAAIETRLGDTPEAKAYAHDTRKFCSLLAETLAPAAGTDKTLTSNQRAELARQFREPAAPGTPARFRRASVAWVVGFGAVAAALVLWSGRFMGPAAPTVAMDTGKGAPEAMPDSGTNEGFGGSRGTALDKRSRRLDDQTDPIDLGRREPAVAGEKPGETTDALVAGAETSRFKQPTRGLDVNFGLNPEPAALPPADAPGDRTLALGALDGLEKNKTTTWEVQDGQGVALNQPLAESRASESLAAENPPTVAQLGATPPSSLAAAADAKSIEALKLRVAGVDTEAKLAVPEAIAPTGAVAGGAQPASTAPAPGASLTHFFAESDLKSDFGFVPAKPTAEKAGADQLAELEDFSVSVEAEVLRRSRGGATTRARTPARPADGATPAAGAGLDGFETTLSLESAATTRAGERGFESESTRSGSDRYYRYAIPPPPESTAESYAAVPENPFRAVATEPVSTFSVDVDTAAYANVRRFLTQGQRPPPAAVRLEEMVNYFRYDYPQPEAGKPFSVSVDLADCPWQSAHRLARVGLKGRDVMPDKRPQSNLVFLIDVSGSMDEPNKLPLVRQSLHMLSSQLGEKDRVAMVTYAGDSGLALESTNGTDRAKIGGAIDRLTPGGSTNGASGIQLAYDVAQQNFVKEGVNRVLLATDGDFNVGVTSPEALEKLITERAKGGVFLSVLGYGMGNLKDSTMEMLADKGNGNYAYIDNLGEARKVLTQEMSGTLVTIAKDVKIQVEFNSAVVRGYRLLGYENRMLARQDFNDDKKDAGEIGAGHTVTALYELVPVGAPPEVPPVDPLRYTPPPIVAAAGPVDTRKALDPAIARETMTVKLRYKNPDADASQLIEVPVVDREARFVEAPADFKFAASVAMFGMLLKESAHKSGATWDQVRQFALEGKGPDPLGYRGEFIQLVERARGVAP